MIVVDAVKVKRDKPGDWYMVMIVTENEPSKLEITGSDVEGMNDDDRIAAGSIMISPKKKYAALSDGKFTTLS